MDDDVVNLCGYGAKRQPFFTHFLLPPSVRSNQYYR